MATVVIFIAVLAVLVLSHELGHFLAAKRSGMKVFEFGFGFPPRLFGWYRDPETKKIKLVGNKFDRESSPGTVYSINALPLGGFVQIKGENDTGLKDADSFSARPWWRRVLVMSAGVLMNILLGAILLGIGYGIGLPQAIDNMADVSGIADRRLEIADVVADKPAALAGLKAGDLILSVDGINNPRVKEFQQYLNTKKDQEIKIVALRGLENITISVRPVELVGVGRAGIGVSIAEMGTVHYPWYQALFYGFKDAFLYLGQIIVAFVTLLKGLFSGIGAGEAVSGPVGIAVMTGRAAHMGFLYLLQFTAILSLNLAVFNFLPFPALDGGRLVFLMIEKIKGKPVGQKTEQMVHSLGYMFLLVLVLIVTIRDVGVFGNNIAGFFSNLF